MYIYSETERLTLRRFTAADADLLIELDSDPAVMRFLTGGTPTAPEVIRESRLPRIIAGYERWRGDLGLFAAHEKDGGAFIGWFCLRPERQGPPDEAELGYRLRQAAWGRGYATDRVPGGRSPARHRARGVSRPGVSPAASRRRPRSAAWEPSASSAAARRSPR
ncbi:GNAT family N-acetyltransferase [Streptomyces sp. NPDC088254]|uniref:GNAT family N-acetyltransferase n=1 Tax=Streptomyces sp. NPDC088254 TaxID=3365847 RepID=UPI0038107F0E